MSRDIRSFFQCKKPLKAAKVEDDDDIIPESPDVQIKNKKKESRKKRILCDDSDEEIFSKKKKPNHDSKQHSQSKGKNESEPKDKLKEVKSTDLFGNGRIKRTEPIVKKEKKKTEVDIHFDDDFDQTLLLADNLEESINIESTNQEKKDVAKESNTIVKKNGIKQMTPKKDSDNDKSKYFIESKEVIHSKDKSHSTYTDKIEIKVNNDKLNKSPSNNKSIKISGDKEKKVDTKNKDKSKKDMRKHEFAEFASDKNDDTVIEDYEDGEPKSAKKTKFNKSLNESVLSDEDRFERKRLSRALYQNFLNRSGPKHLGAKEMPEGSPNCLKDCAFLLTGVLDSFERDEVLETIKKYGGAVKSGVTRKVTHVLAGEDAGPAKIAKAQELGIKIIDEDSFIRIINELSHKPSVKSDKRDTKADIKTDKHRSPNKSSKSESNKRSKSHESKRSHKLHDIKKDISPKKEKTTSVVIEDKKVEVKREHKEHKKAVVKIEVKSENRSNHDTAKETKKQESGLSSIVNIIPANSQMWVEKYKPQNVKQIIGQHGDASNVKKLTNWLSKWYTNRKAKLAKPNPWAKNDDGGYYKAALLSGPPGVGKTTTVALVCRELGFDVVEFNASDTRNKTLIKEQIGELLSTNSLSGYAKGDTGKQAVSKKHVLVMDEVDGMAGNEDRGGLQELISLIKSTSVPIVCMCNDRNSQKMRSFVNYCYDLRFNRPRVDQIKSAMLSVCFKEGIKIPQDVLTQLIVAANQDVRQTLNLLSMWSVDKNLDDTDRLRADAKKIRKDVKLGPWEAIRKVFSAEDHKTMSIMDKSDLFFYDYSLAPLFVQENYLQVAPHCPKNEVLDRISKAADSISCGDLVDARIRRNQAWGLLPSQAMYSSVIPGHHMSGHVTGQIQFPGWLGKNSRKTKMHRLCQEIHAHTRLCTSGSKSSIFLDYSSYLRDAIVTPLIKDRSDGIESSMAVLESYHLLREDLDSLVELSLWPGQRNPTVLIDSKVKAAMTRMYNKKATALPYAQASVKKGRARNDDEEGVANDDEREDVVDDDDDQHDSDPENDALIKKKKPTQGAKTKLNEEKPSTSKGKKKGKK